MANLTWSTVPNTVSSGASKVSRINTQRGAIDSAITEQYTLAVDTSEAITTAVLGTYMVFRFPAANTIAQTLTIPSSNPRLFAVVNASAFDMTVVKGSTSITVKAGYGEIFYSGIGTNNLLKITPSNSEATRFTTINIYANGSYSASEVIAQSVINSFTTIPAALLNSIFRLEVAPTAETVFDVLVNGISRGTLTFAAAATSPTISFISDVEVDSGDIISIRAPSSVDATAAGLYGVLELKANLDGSPLDNIVFDLSTEGETAGSQTFHDVSVNDFTITTTGNTNVQADGSIYFDGDGDWLTVPHDSQISVANSNDMVFEVEFNWDGTGDSTQCFFNKRDGTDAEEFRMNLIDGKIQFATFVASNVDVNLVDTFVVSSGVWYNFKAERISGTWTIFLNGNSVASQAESATPSANGAALQIGRSAFNNAREFKGYIRKARIIQIP